MHQANLENWRTRHLVSCPICGTKTREENLTKNIGFWHSPYKLYEACITCKHWRRVRWGTLVMAILIVIILEALGLILQYRFYCRCWREFALIGLCCGSIGAVALASGYSEKLSFAQMGMAGSLDDEEEGKRLFQSQRLHFHFTNWGAIMLVIGFLLQAISLLLSNG